MFQATVIDNTSLSGVQKLQYLRSFLKGESELLLQSIQITESNFQDAWDILLGRYHHQREIIYAHLKRLTSQTPINSSSPSNLRKLVDTTNECVRALRVMHQPVDSWETFLIFLVIEKLDLETRRQWALSAAPGDAMPTFKRFMSFLDQRARALSESTGQCPKSRSKTEYNYNNKARIASSHLTPASSYCRLCGENHSHYKCSKLLHLSATERKALVKSHSLCFNCLKPDHRVSDCKAGT